MKNKLLDEKYLDDLTCELNEIKKRLGATSSVEIWYNEASVKKDKEKFTGRSYHTIIIDEATELLKSTLIFLSRSTRRSKENQIPLHLLYIINLNSS